MKPLDPLARAVIDAARVFAAGTPRASSSTERLRDALEAFDVSERPIVYVDVDRVDVRAGDEVLLPRNRIWRVVRRVQEGTPLHSEIVTEPDARGMNTYYSGPCRVRRRAP